MKPRVLIVGGDSLIGKALHKKLLKLKWAVFITTRRKDTLTKERLYLSFPFNVNELDLPEVDLAIICAAGVGHVNSLSEAEGYQVNVTSPVILTNHLLRKGVYVVFLSTSSVFDGEKANLTILDKKNPKSNYAIQKSDAEDKIIGNYERCGAQNFCIVRLTKVVDWNLELFRRWRADLQSGKPIYTYSDLNLSPITLDYVTDNLIQLFLVRSGGILHFSGENDVSYFNFFRKIFHGHKAYGLIRPASIRDSSSANLYAPLHATLSMDESRKLGFMPNKLADVVRNMKSSLL